MRTTTSALKNLVDNPAVKGSAVVFVGSMAVNFGAYIFHVIVGRILGVEKYGELAAILSLFFILNVPSMVIQVVLTKYFAIYKARKAYGEARGLLEKGTLFLFVFGLLGFLVFLLCIPALSSYLKLSHSSNLLALYAIFFTYLLSTVSLSALTGFQLFFPSMALQTVVMIFRLVLSSIGAMFGVFSALLGSVGSNLLGLVLFIIPLRFLFKEKTKKIALSKRHLIEFAIPTLFATLGMTMLYSQDVVLIKHFFSSEQAGIYSSLNLFGKIIFFASAAISAVVFPIITERKELKKSYHQVVYGAVFGVGGISLVIVIAYFFAAQFLITTLFGKSFQSAAPYLASFGIFMAFVTVSNLLMTICLATQKLKVALFLIAASIAQIVGIYLFHGTIHQVINVNIAVAACLSVSLLGYYRYGT